jgi:hypothetical protein
VTDEADHDGYDDRYLLSYSIYGHNLDVSSLNVVDRTAARYADRRAME